MEREELEEDLSKLLACYGPTFTPTSHGMVQKILAAFGALREERDALAEKMVFLRSQCPEERSDDAPGFSQSEAYFWKNRAEKDHSRLARADALAEAGDAAATWLYGHSNEEGQEKCRENLKAKITAYRADV